MQLSVPNASLWAKLLEVFFLFFCWLMVSQLKSEYSPGEGWIQPLFILINIEIEGL